MQDLSCSSTTVVVKKYKIIIQLLKLKNNFLTRKQIFLKISSRQNAKHSVSYSRHISRQCVKLILTKDMHISTLLLYQPLWYHPIRSGEEYRACRLFPSHFREVADFRTLTIILLCSQRKLHNSHEQLRVHPQIHIPLQSYIG